MKVTNSHHWGRGVTLEIQDGGLRWTVDRKQQKFKYDTIRVTPGDAEGFAILDPVEFDKEFIDLITLMFEFTGVGSDNIKVENPAPGFETDTEARRTATIQKIIDLIYAQSLPRKARLVWLDISCSCPGGAYPHHCDTEKRFTEVELMPVATTYGDLFKVLGNRIEIDGVTHFAYRDSVWLELDALPKFHDAVKNANLKIETDPETLYIKYRYGR